MRVALDTAGPQMADTGQSASDNDRRQRGGENKARGIRAHRIDQICLGGNIAAHQAKALGERPLDDINPVSHPVALGDAAALGPVKPNGMHLVQIGQRAIFFGQVANCANWGNIAVHRIYRLEGDDFGRFSANFNQLPLKVGKIVMGENALGAAPIANAIDHRSMVHLVGKNHRAGNDPRQCAQRRLVGYVARGKQQGCLFAVQVGKFALQLDVEVGGAGNIAGAARAAANIVQRRVHGAQHLGVLTHAQIIVGTPDDDILLPPGGKMAGIGEIPTMALDIGKFAIPAFGFDRVEGALDRCFIIWFFHTLLSRLPFYAATGDYLSDGSINPAASRAFSLQGEARAGGSRIGWVEEPRGRSRARGYFLRAGSESGRSRSAQACAAIEFGFQNLAYPARRPFRSTADAGQTDCRQCRKYPAPARSG